MENSNSSISESIRMIRHINSNNQPQRDTLGLSVEVLSRQSSIYPQLSNRRSDLILVDGRGNKKRNLDAARSISPDEDYLVLIEKVLFGEVHLRAVPKSILDSGVSSMFGGNFIYTSDSRFPSDQPIKVFDRVE